MDRSWDIEAWEPTAPVFSLHSNWSRPGKKTVLQLRDLLIERAKDVVQTPYFPLARLKRGDVLFKLGYPELAAGDAYKVIMLCEAGMSYESARGVHVRVAVGMSLLLEDSNMDCWQVTAPAEDAQRTVSSRVKEDRKEAYNLLLSALLQMEDLRPAKAVCRKAQFLHPNEAKFTKTLGVILNLIEGKKIILENAGVDAEVVESRTRAGGIQFHRYPWIPPKFFERGPELIDAINGALRSSSAAVEIRQSQIGDFGSSTSSIEKPSCFGFFATRDIKAGGQIMKAPTALAVCSKQTSTHCYNCAERLGSHMFMFPCCEFMRFCSSECRQIAEQNYHRTVCGRYFTPIYQNAEFAPDEHCPEMRALFWLRILACCVQRDCHPLEMPEIARLLAHYGSNLNNTWTFRANVVTTFQVLDQCGVDVFADPRYDGWVIEVIWHRIKNNAAGSSWNGVQSMSVNGDYSGFNHSCEFPPMIVSERSNSTAEWTAFRAIRKGEEVFTTYLDPEQMLAPKKTRQLTLMAWLDRPCACSRCKSESG